MHPSEILYALWAIVVWSLLRGSYRKHVTVPTREWLKEYCENGKCHLYEDPRQRIISFAQINRRDYVFILMSAASLLVGLAVLGIITYLFGLSWVAIAIYVGFVMAVVEITLSTNLDCPSIQVELQKTYKKLEGMGIIQNESVRPPVRS